MWRRCPLTPKCFFHVFVTEPLLCPHSQSPSQECPHALGFASPMVIQKIESPQTLLGAISPHNAQNFCPYPTLHRFFKQEQSSLNQAFSSFSPTSFSCYDMKEFFGWGSGQAMCQVYQRKCLSSCFVEDCVPRKPHFCDLFKTTLLSLPCSFWQTC